jgi:hypothetical protein
MNQRLVLVFAGALPLLLLFGMRRERDRLRVRQRPNDAATFKGKDWRVDPARARSSYNQIPKEQP